MTNRDEGKMWVKLGVVLTIAGFASSYWLGLPMLLASCIAAVGVVSIIQAFKTDRINEREAELDRRESDLRAIAERLAQAQQNEAQRVRIVPPMLDGQNRDHEPDRPY